VISRRALRIPKTGSRASIARAKVRAAAVANHSVSTNRAEPAAVNARTVARRKAALREKTKPRRKTELRGKAKPRRKT
jgi:hypothetical protein